MIILTIILILFIILKNSSTSYENFVNPQQSSNYGKTSFDIMPKKYLINEKDKLLNQYRQRPLEFRLNTYQQPLLGLSIAENSDNITDNVLYKNKPPPSTLKKFINNYDREIPQNPNRISTYTPLAFNDRVKDSKASLNTIPNISLQENQKLNRNISQLVINDSNNIPNDLNNYSFETVEPSSNSDSHSLDTISKWFVDKLNSISNGHWKFVSRQDSKILNGIPIPPQNINNSESKVESVNKATNQSNKQYTRYDTIMFMYETLGLMSKGVNISVLKEESVNNLNKPKLYLLNAQMIVTDEEQFDSKVSGYNNLEKRSNITKYEPFYNLQRDPNLMEVTDDMIQSELKKRQYQKENEQYQCYGSVIVGAKTKMQCEDSGGRWDKPVKKSTECPFYLANKNYPNKRGGVIGDYKCAHPLEGNQKCNEWKYGGHCEMPMGIQKIGYRFTQPNSKPLCYNCLNGLYGHKTIGFCCEEQKDPIKYPSLSSPDYVFPDSMLSRFKHKNRLHDKDLFYHPKGKAGESNFEKHSKYANILNNLS